MTQQNNKQIRVTYITPAFRLSFPALFEPVAVMGDETKKKYGATMLFPKKSTVEALKAVNHPAAKYMAADNCAAFYQEMCKVARGNFGPDVDVKSLKITKFRDGDKPRDSGKLDDNEKGYIVVRTSTGEKNKPQCIDQAKKPITDPSILYPGCWVRAVLTVAPFVKPTRGVTVYLVGVQKLADDTTFSSRPRVEDEFDAVAVEAVDPLSNGGVEVPTDELPY